MLNVIVGIAGIASQAVGLASLVATISMSPWFVWTEHDLSFCGVEGSATKIFNSGLIIAGLLSLVFAAGLWGSPFSARWPGKLSIACLALGSAGLSATGICPRTMVLPHNIASLSFFVFTAAAICLFGLEVLTGGSVVWGWLSIIAAVIMVTLQQFPWPWTGRAIPQMLSASLWSLWTIAVAVRLLTSLEGLGFRG